MIRGSSKAFANKTSLNSGRCFFRYDPQTPYIIYSVFRSLPHRPPTETKALELKSLSVNFAELIPR